MTRPKFSEYAGEIFIDNGEVRVQAHSVERDSDA